MSTPLGNMASPGAVGTSGASPAELVEPGAPDQPDHRVLGARPGRPECGSTSTAAGPRPRRARVIIARTGRRVELGPSSRLPGGSMVLEERRLRSPRARPP